MNRIITILIVFALFSCDKQKSKELDESEKKLKVITVNYPLFYFAERIGGDLIEMQYIIPEDVDPAYWKPNEAALNLYQSADIIIDNGADYAKWMENVSLPSSRIVNTSSSFADNLIPLKNIASHNHGPDGEHEHNGFAFTSWLDFQNAIKQAEAIKNILVKKIPTEEQLLNENFESLRSDLQELHKEMIDCGLELNEYKLAGSHPVYQYLSKAYDLNIKSVHFEPDVFPSKEQWKNLDQFLTAASPNLMLWENTPIQDIKNELVIRNLKIIVFNPCANKPIEEDFLSVMKNNISNFKN